MYDEVQMFKHRYRQWRLGEAHGVKGERISDGVLEQIVFLNDRCATVAGVDDESIKRLIASVGLYTPEGSGIETIWCRRERLKPQEWRMCCSRF